jgi:glycine cleavage system aminomethyltransferase T
MGIRFRKLQPKLSRPEVCRGSAAWAETLGCAAGLGYLGHPEREVVTPEFVAAGRYQVNAAGQLYPAGVSLRPPFDPDGHRVRA